jgi:hypothetical protein
MLSKITLAFAFAMAILTTLPAFVGSSFAQYQGGGWPQGGDAPYGSCTTYYHGKGPC